MKKCSTPTQFLSSNTVKDDLSQSPKEITLAFIRQFARVYRPAPRIDMPGIVLN